VSIYNADDAINYLVTKMKKVDIKASSHWVNYHSEFDFKDGEFAGIRGFGSNRQSYTGIRKIVHHLLQAPFRAMG